MYRYQSNLKIFIPILILLAISCNQQPDPTVTPITKTSLIILGTIQDAGSPHIACTKNCCKDLFMNPDINRQIVSLGIIDPENKKTFLFEATPDLPRQMKNLKSLSSFNIKETPDAIFLTHAHIGHYAGLMYLGKEAMNADSLLVYAMPRMKSFLEMNGPWSQLLTLKNIKLQVLANAEVVMLTPNINVTPLIVPHRDEYSETVGYIISGPNKRVLFIPDIDKWERWNAKITEVIAGVDYAFIDGTFYDEQELNNRNMKDIPHPFIIESMEKFKKLPAAEKDKIYFIHFNHTNPALDPNSPQAKTILKNGFHIAEINTLFAL